MLEKSGSTISRDFIIPVTDSGVMITAVAADCIMQDSENQIRIKASLAALARKQHEAVLSLKNCDDKGQKLTKILDQAMCFKKMLSPMNMEDNTFSNPDNCYCISDENIRIGIWFIENEFAEVNRKFEFTPETLARFAIALQFYHCGGLSGRQIIDAINNRTATPSDRSPKEESSQAQSFSYGGGGGPGF
jgi:hypothetical protein